VTLDQVGQGIAVEGEERGKLAEHRAAAEPARPANHGTALCGKSMPDFSVRRDGTLRRPPLRRKSTRCGGDRADVLASRPARSSREGGT